MTKYLITLVLLVGIFSLSTASTSPSLTNSHWKLVSLHKKAISTNGHPHREAYITLNNGNISGNSSCNNMRGSYSLDEDKISLSSKGMMMTMMFCQGSVENEFLSVLKEMYTYKIMTNNLFLYNKQGEEIAKFFRNVL